MENDKSVRNQKVFISLEAFSALVKEYERVKNAIEDGRRQLADVNTLVVRKQAFEFMFNTTQLPVSI